jgi:hypothetical protein
MMEPPPLTIFAAVFTVAAIALWLAWTLYKKNRELTRRLGYRAKAWPTPPPTAPKTPEQERAELYDRQLEAVIRQQVTFRRRKVMNGGEYQLFRAAMGVTRQPLPGGAFPFYVFPQVSLGQIIGTQEPGRADDDEAFRAINSKRCDLLIADRNGLPLAVLEYQGSGHNIGGTATRRDEIKRIALSRAGVQFVEIKDGTASGEIDRIIRELLARQQSPKQLV